MLEIVLTETWPDEKGEEQTKSTTFIRHSVNAVLKALARAGMPPIHVCALRKHGEVTGEVWGSVRIYKIEVKDAKVG